MKNESIKRLIITYKRQKVETECGINLVVSKDFENVIKQAVEIFCNDFIKGAKIDTTIKVKILDGPMGTVLEDMGGENKGLKTVELRIQNLTRGDSSPAKIDAQGKSASEIIAEALSVAAWTAGLKGESRIFVEDVIID